MDGFQRRTEQKKETIRRAAMELFKTYGFGKVSVTDIARALNVSRRNLERVFSESLGRGVAWHLRVRRVEACKTMLRETDMTVAEISKASGIGRPEHLHRLFRKTLGVTPTQFREKARSDFSGESVHISPAPKAPPST